MNITGNNVNEQAMYKEPVMTYNHMQEEPMQGPGARSKAGLKSNVVVRFIAEELIIALLLALIFYMI